ncbi:MAG: hypothetical protein JWN68_1936 [Nocardioides sp.]|uniref:hypothetical protein n=1 Tax=Nocardioides sp. TaxID=35761 RepID=UPI00261075F4|nr:hypothetical protein [Nocardioides sp.]MCW2833983.1 hypothetical protein [Nocardioides sp.]
MQLGFLGVVAALLVLWMALENKCTAIDTRLARMERLRQRIAEHITGADLAAARAAVDGIDRGDSPGPTRLDA